MPSSGLSGWETFLTTVVNAAAPAYSAIEQAKATKAAAESAAATARIQASLDSQKLALESRMSSAAVGGRAGVAGVNVPLVVGGVAVVGLVAYLLFGRK